MKRNRFFYTLFFFFFITGKFYSQSVERIKFKKEPGLIYFFQKGIKSDTIVKGKNNLFYLVVPDSLKNIISIHIENGQLRSTANDSLVEFYFLKGFKYESLYDKKESAAKYKNKKEYVFKTLINGTSDYPKEKIRIQIVNRKDNEVMLENAFFYKD